MKVKVSNTWRNVIGIYVKVSNTWRTVTTLNTKVSNVWREGWSGKKFVLGESVFASNTLTFVNGNPRLFAFNNQYGDSWISMYFKNKIDVTNISKIRVYAKTATNTNDFYGSRIALSVSNQTTGKYWNSALGTGSSLTFMNSRLVYSVTPGWYELNVAHITGQVWFLITADAGSGGTSTSYEANIMKIETVNTSNVTTVIWEGTL